MALIFAMLLGADRIDDCELLRVGRTRRLRRVACGLRVRHGHELLPAVVSALHARPPPGAIHITMKGDSNDGNDKVLINLSTGLEDAERVTVALLVATAAVSAGKQVAIWLTKEAVRLALPGFAEAVACEGCAPLSRLVAQFADGGGELLACPICSNAQTQRGGPRSERPHGGRNPTVGVDRRRLHRLQLLTGR
jgi:predicted peroxiredoxin